MEIRHEHRELREAVADEAGPLLKMIAEITGNPGIAKAMVTTLSSVGDFTFARGPGLEEKTAELLERELSARHGFPVKCGDRLIEVARRGK